jgi:Ca2+-binding RTX toxin-like protein
MDILQTASDEIGVVGGANGVNTVTGYQAAVIGEPIANQAIGGFTYTGESLFARTPTSILFLDRPAWLDGSTALSNGNGWSILGGASADTLIGGANNDTILAGNGANSIVGGAGADSITTGTGADTILGDAGNDTILGGDGANSILGGAGADVITSGNTASYIDGGTEADSITAGTGADTILGGDGANTIDAGNGDNFVSAGIDTDIITAGTGADTILGDAGNDTILGGGGVDSIDGGADNDRIIFATSADFIDAASIIGGTGIDSIQLTTNDQTLDDPNFGKVDDIDVLQFVDGNNAVTIGATALGAFEGIATLIGGSGNDTMTQTAAFSTGINMQGGSGNDLFNIDSALLLSQNTIAGGADTTVDKISVTTTLFDATLAILGNVTGVEQLDFAAGANVSLTGAWGIETINGGAGNSTIDASTVGFVVGSGIVINGQNAGADSLIGGTGKDTLQAATSNLNTNNDTLTGGAGADLFVLGDGEDNFYGNISTGSLATPNAKITDFKTGEDAMRLFANGIAGDREGIDYVTLETGAGTADWKINLYNGSSITGTPLTYFADITSSGTGATIYQKTGGSTYKIADLSISNPGDVANVFDNVQFVTPPVIG